MCEAILLPYFEFGGIFVQFVAIFAQSPVNFQLWSYRLHWYEFMHLIVWVKKHHLWIFLPLFTQKLRCTNIYTLAFPAAVSDKEIMNFSATLAKPLYKCTFWSAANDSKCVAWKLLINSSSGKWPSLLQMKSDGTDLAVAVGDHLNRLQRGFWEVLGALGSILALMLPTNHCGFVCMPVLDNLGTINLSKLTMTSNPA